MLHQVSAGVVRDHGVRHAVLSEFPGGKRSALIARARLVGIDVQVDPFVVRHVDRSGGRATVDGREPAGIAMREHVHAPADFALGDPLDQLQPFASDRLIDGDVLVRDLLRAFERGIGTFAARAVPPARHHFFERPFQIDGGRPGREQRLVGALERLIRRVRTQREPEAVGGRGAEQRRAAHLHRRNRARGVIEAREPCGHEAMWKLRLVYDADARSVRFQPDRAGRLTVDVHAAFLANYAAAVVLLPAPGLSRILAARRSSKCRSTSKKNTTTVRGCRNTRRFSLAGRTRRPPTAWGRAAASIYSTGRRRSRFSISSRPETTRRSRCSFMVVGGARSRRKISARWRRARTRTASQSPSRATISARRSASPTSSAKCARRACSSGASIAGTSPSTAIRRAGISPPAWSRPTGPRLHRMRRPISCPPLMPCPAYTILLR